MNDIDDMTSQDQDDIDQAAQHADSLERRRRAEAIINILRYNDENKSFPLLSKMEIDFLETELGLK